MLQQASPPFILGEENLEVGFNTSIKHCKLGNDCRHFTLALSVQFTLVFYKALQANVNAYVQLIKYTERGRRVSYIKTTLTRKDSKARIFLSI